MFNNLKSIEFFNPDKIKEKEVHIIGAGAVGASVAELLTRLGLRRITIWDADTVAPHNLGNQCYRTKDIGRPKTEALSEILTDINPELQITIKGLCSVQEKLSGYIFLCIDNIDVRREFCTKWKLNPNIIFICDGRMGLTTGYVYSADWHDLKEKNNLIASMQYTHEEVLKVTPVSACGMTLSVVITPRLIAGLMVSNWIKFINTGTYNRLIEADGYAPITEAYPVC